MVPQEVEEYAAGVVSLLKRVLGAGLQGVYLHGSGAMGGWYPATSDVDVLAVARALTEDEKREIAGRLTDIGFAAPGKGLEFSVVTPGAFAPLLAKPPFELHVATGADSKVVDGAGHAGDSDLVMHFAVCRARGIAFFGQPPSEVFPEVPRETLLRCFQDELEWALGHAPPRYAVLNASRAWAFAEGEGLLSKVEGAAWATGNGHNGALVVEALAAQEGGPEPRDVRAVRAYVAAAQNALSEACASA